MEYYINYGKIILYQDIKILNSNLIQVKENN